MDSIKRIHWDSFSKSHMDYDISEINKEGVPIEHKDRYDRNFLTHMFDESTLEKLKKVNFTNITTSCTKQTLNDAITEHNVNKAMLYILSKVIFDEDLSDGIVALKSAKYIEDICNEKNINIKVKRIKNGHHDVASDIRIIKEIIDIR